jgi:hypothetical protein
MAQNAHGLASVTRIHPTATLSFCTNVSNVPRPPLFTCRPADPLAVLLDEGALLLGKGGHVAS